MEFRCVYIFPPFSYCSNQGVKNSSRVIKNLIMEISQITNQASLPQCYGNKIPIEVQIGADSFTIKPQYPETQMRLIEILIRAIWPVIPEDEELFINNWTQGLRIGHHIQPMDTVAELLLESNKTIPKIRVCWVNCPTFKVQVELHDMLILYYDQLNIFHYMADLFDSITNDIKKKFKLKSSTRFKLKIQGEPKKYRRLAFVGRYFDLQRVNKIKMIINFEEDLPIQFVKAKRNAKFDQFVCPISQLIMQEPVITTCKHKFDKLCLMLALEKNGKCPVCRRCLEAGDFKSARELAREVKKLKALEIDERLSSKEKMEEHGSD